MTGSALFFSRELANAIVAAIKDLNQDVLS